MSSRSAARAAAASPDAAISRARANNDGHRRRTGKTKDAAPSARVTTFRMAAWTDSASEGALARASPEGEDNAASALAA